jgi:hypothetical protein
MRTLTILLGIVAAIALVLQLAPCATELYATFFADLEAYLVWILEERSMVMDPSMMAEEAIHP